MNRLTLATPILAVVVLGLGACSKDEKPVPTVSFINDVQPILAASCLECHTEGAAGTKASGLNMDSYDLLMNGTEFGSIIKPGDSATSALNMLVEGRADPSIRMPHGKDPLTPDETNLLKLWVDEGALNN